MGKSKRERILKECEHCKKVQPLLYRVRLQAIASWLFLCAECLTKVKSQKRYQYGGTWKQIKRN
jgi:hypothetical protein